MYSGEQLSPDGSGDFDFNGPDFWQDLGAAEFEVDQPYELAKFIVQLNAVYGNSIDAREYFIASGIGLQSSRNGNTIEEPLSEFYGRITGFKLHMLLNRYYAVVDLYNDELEKAKHLILSIRPGYEFVMLNELPLDCPAETLDYYRELNKNLFEMNELLSLAAVVIARKDVASSIEDVKALEILIMEDYGVMSHSEVLVTGTSAMVGDGMSPIADTIPPHITESGYSGRYLGLTVKELAGSVEDEKQTRLCMAIELLDGSVVLQPCDSIHTAMLTNAK